MKTSLRTLFSGFCISVMLISVLPCGPGWVTPLFEVQGKPESPYDSFAAGRLGIVKPSFSRSVLYAAYRHINGGGMNADEQKAMVDIWKADFDRKDFREENLKKAVDAWIAKRKEVVEKDEKTPEIYVERTYGGYDFFPNCTQNAFEVAAATLGDRITTYSSTDKNVKNWVAAQDKVFTNCASGKQMPHLADPAAPQWLQKDRAYQLAAASFYSLDYEDAKKRFEDISRDFESPWQETSDYLVARTLVRQASLSKDEKKAAKIYAQAETWLEHFVSRSGKFSDSVEKMIGLIAYRIHPRERAGELARKLVLPGDDNFRQDVIDYNWLLDKFESEILTAEEKRKHDEEAAKNKSSNVNTAANTVTVTNSNTAPPTVIANTGTSSAAVNANSAPTKAAQRKNDDDLQINLYSPDYQKSWTFYVRFNATDDEAIAEAEKAIGSPLSDELKKRVRELRQSAYTAQFTDNLKNGYEGGYYGDEKLSISSIPDYLRRDPLTDWLYAYQMRGAEAYLYSLKKFRETHAEIWLISALNKADKTSTQLDQLFEAADKANRLSPGYPTVAYETARIQIALGKNAEAKKLIDEMIGKGDVLPISAINSFVSLRFTLGETLADFLKYSLKRPYAFDFSGQEGSIDEIIAEQKSYYDPEYNKDGREAYEREIDEQYKTEKMWQDRLMFDSDTIATMNQNFPMSVLLDVEKSDMLPEYMREKFAVAIWTRAALLGDQATADKIAPDLAKFKPEFEPFLTKIAETKTPAARQNAVMFFLLKNPYLSPYIEEGMGKTDNEFNGFDSNDWWCSSYESDTEEAGPDDYAAKAMAPPRFLTAAQTKAAKLERKKLRNLGDAPQYLADRVMEWARRYPTDRRVPEALYIVYQANGWTKYGCGNNNELHEEIGAYLKKHYPNSEWVKKMTEEESDQN